MQVILISVFIIGYILIVFERSLKLNKAAAAIITGVLCWSVLIIFSADKTGISGELMRHTGDIAAVLFFLLGAMTIVELIEAHNGFDIVTGSIGTGSRLKLLWIISILTFFLSSILDNLTTTIIMVVLTGKLITEAKERLYFSGIIVIAANAGGVWSPIGDVTTTMLWIGQRITSWNIVKTLIIPGLVNLAVPLAVLSFLIGKGTGDLTGVKKKLPVPVQGKIVLFSGLLLLVAVPVFKSIVHLPPFMGMLMALGILWVITELMHKKKDEKDRYRLSVLSALRNIDMTTILFFLGILLAVSSLQTAGLLDLLAGNLDRLVGNINYVPVVIGIVSAVIDNVPLVAASIGMYPLSSLPTDHRFWELLAYCTGTGGSILIIGSAAGVAAMGLEKIGFFDYLKKIGWLAFLGYFAGAGVYFLQTIII